MAITADWQGNLGSLTFGAGTEWEIEPPGISGLGIPSPRTRDSERGDQAGDVGGDDVLPRRVLYLPLVGTFSSPGAAWQAFEEELKVAFAETIVDEALDLRLEGMPATGRRFYGRARGLVEDLSNLKSSTVRALCTFEALDPYGYGEEELEAEADGTFPVENIGTAATDRVVLTFTGNGGTPRLVNAADDGGDFTLGEVLAGSDVRVVDVRSRTIVDGSGDEAYSVAPGTLWWVLRPGVNALTLTGAASVDVAFRPAYR